MIEELVKGYAEDYVFKSTMITGETASIMAQAEKELLAEKRLEAIKAAKEKLLDRWNKPWYKKLFPYRVILERI